MGCMITRPGIGRHAYAPMQQPAWVVRDAVTAIIPAAHGGQTTYPVASGVATFASDGAPFYNTGWQPGQAVQAGGGTARFALPPRAAQIDLTDRESWDRPVFWPGSH